MGLGRFLSCAFLISRVKYGKCKCRVCIWTSKWQKVCSVSTLLYFLVIFRKSLSSWGRKESDATECLNWTELTSLRFNYILYKNDFISYFMVIIRIQWGNICENAYYRDFPGGSDGKESASKARDPGLIPGLGRSSGEENGNPLQYSYLENPMDRGTWKATYSPWGHRVGRDWVTNTTTTTRDWQIIGLASNVICRSCYH